MSPVTLDFSTAEDRHGGSLMVRRPMPPLVGGAGAWVWDRHGTRYLDLTAAYGVSCLGHGPSAVSEAIARQAGELLSCPGSLRCEARGRFLARLHAVLPERLAHSFLTNSGTEAVEAALKFATAVTGRHRFVALSGGFHGRTLGALSLTWRPEARRPFTPLLAETAFVRRDDPEALEEAVDRQTAAVVIEVIQGEGGVHPLDPRFLHAAQALAREHGALLVIDEIQTGFGRTGAWFAHPDSDLEPDLVTLAKGIGGGMPLGAAVYTDEVAAALTPALHGSTFGANPLACAAGEAVIGELERGGWVERARRLGERWIAGLRRALDGRRRVREIRGRGLMVGIELREKVAPVLAGLLESHRILALPAGSTVLRLLPPLVVEEADLERSVAALAETLS